MDLFFSKNFVYDYTPSLLAFMTNQLGSTYSKAMSLKEKWYSKYRWYLTDYRIMTKKAIYFKK